MLDNLFEQYSIPVGAQAIISFAIAFLVWASGAIPEHLDLFGWSTAAVAIINFILRWLAWYKATKPMPVPPTFGDASPAGAPAPQAIGIGDVRFWF